MESLMVDMDDVIVTSEGWLYLINEYLGTNYTYDDVDGYYIQNLVPKELRQDFLDNYFAERNFYDYCNINPYAIEVLKELNEVYKICIGTAWEIPGSLKASRAHLNKKFDFLQEHFPFLSLRSYSFTNDKSFLEPKIKIDDVLHNLDSARKKILYTTFHNKNISKGYLIAHNIHRVDDWLDIKRLLLTNKN